MKKIILIALLIQVFYYNNYSQTVSNNYSKNIIHEHMEWDEKWLNVIKDLKTVARQDKLTSLASVTDLKTIKNNIVRLIKNTPKKTSALLDISFQARNSRFEKSLISLDIVILANNENDATQFFKLFFIEIDDIVNSNHDDIQEYITRLR